MANKKREISLFIEKRAMLNVLERVFDQLEDISKDCTMTYEVVGKRDEQDTNWRTGELLWEDDEKTIPKMKDKYDYVPIPEDDMTDEQICKLHAINEIKNALEKLI